MWEYFLKSEKYVEDGGIIREKSKRTLPKPQRSAYHQSFAEFDFTKLMVRDAIDLFLCTCLQCMYECMW